MTASFSTVAVIGLGTTGSAVAAEIAHTGLAVIAVEKCDASLARGRARVEGRIARCREAQGLAPEAPAAGLGRITWSTQLAATAAADLVIEAVPERRDSKDDVFRAANKVCAPDAVFATTTTALPITELAVASGRAGRTVGLHLLNPMPDGRVAELVRTPLTEAAVLDDVRQLIWRMARTPVVVSDRAGFIGGALMLGYLNAAATMYEQRYASRDDIDAAMMFGCGLPRGPLAQLDILGLDVALDALQAMYERSGDRQYAPAPLLGHMVSAGLLGRKTGRGFYAYRDPDDASGLPIAGDVRARPRGEARPVRRIGVVGTGTMGAGIAEVSARAGVDTVIVARTETKAKDVIARVERSLAKAAERGKLAPAEVDAALAHLAGFAGFSPLAECDVVIEAVAEDIDVKRRVFTELDRICRDGAVLSTTTSSLPVIECAIQTSRAQDVVGLHFFNPAPRMKLVEVARTVLTSDSAIDTAHEMCTALGKRTVNCTDRSGYIVNALLFPYLNRAVRMFQEHYASDDDLETVMKGVGHPMGPLQLLDVVGLDVSLAIQRRLSQTFKDPELEPAEYLEHLVRLGFLGRKSGRGFLTYNAR
jgi:3-hydroxybutyryl-CoA dehydrogenase